MSSMLQRGLQRARSRSSGREKERSKRASSALHGEWIDLNGGHHDHDDNLVADQNWSKNIMINALVLTTENTNK